MTPHGSDSDFSWDMERGLFLPSHLRLPDPGSWPEIRPMDMMATYVSLDEYAPDIRPEMALAFGRKYPPVAMLEALAILNRVAADPALSEEWRTTFVRQLRPPRDEALASLFSLGADGQRVLLVRQVILNAMRHIFTLEDDTPPTHETVPLVEFLATATLFAHTIAARMPSVPVNDQQLEANQNTEHQILGVPLHLAIELMQNQVFNSPTDPFNLVGRFVRLWTQFDDAIVRTPLRASPRELLLEATGLEFEELFALGHGLYAHAQSWKPGDFLWMREDFNSQLLQERIEKFLVLVSRSLGEFRLAIDPERSDWDFLAFQNTPVLREDGSLLVLDQQFLLERVLLGIYWDVHDYERDGQTEIPGNRARLHWTQAYSEMIEAMVIDHLRRMAPILFGEEGAKTFYSEEDLRKAYPYQGQKIADAAVHFGPGLCLFEIVSGQVKTAFRIEGERQAFRDDTEKLVVEKVEQLDGAARAILADEQALTGYPDTPDLRIVPVVVVAGGFPINPASLFHIEERMQEEGFFKEAQVESLAIIDLNGLEMLEALTEHGCSPFQILVDWANPSNRGTPLDIYLFHRYQQPMSYFRPSWVNAYVTQVLTEAATRLQLRA